MLPVLIFSYPAFFLFQVFLHSCLSTLQCTLSYALLAHTVYTDTQFFNFSYLFRLPPAIIREYTHKHIFKVLLCVYSRHLYVYSRYLCLYSRHFCFYSCHLCEYSHHSCVYSRHSCVYSPICVYTATICVYIPAIWVYASTICV